MQLSSKLFPGYATPSVFIRKWVRDDQGRIVVDKNGNYQQESEFTYAGSAAPKFTAGFTNTFRYRDFSLSVHIDGSFGGKLLSFTNNYLKASGAGKNLFGDATNNTVANLITSTRTPTRRSL